MTEGAIEADGIVGEGGKSPPGDQVSVMSGWDAGGGESKSINSPTGSAKATFPPRLESVRLPPAGNK